MAHKSRPEIPPLEWAIAAIGALIVAAVLVYFGLDAMRADTPPDLVAQVMAVRPASDGWVVEIRLENRGDRTAADVEVGVIEAGTRKSVRFELVPGRSQRFASIVLSSRPTRVPDAEVISFRQP